MNEYRPNVAIVLAHGDGRLFWGRSVPRGGRRYWQFPQGGVDRGESVEAALYRELQEEVGLGPEAVRLVAATEGWMSYELPPEYRRNPDFTGQRQRWFLLQLLADDSALRLDAHEVAEFDDWRWVSYWYPLGQVVHFKRAVYRRALLELAPAYNRMVQC